MSYVVHLWQQPVPTSLAQAEATLRAMRHQLRHEPDPGPGQLLAAIEAALPPGHDPDASWVEQPEADGRETVLSLSPAVAELGTVLPAIEAAARRLGWVVLDLQAGEVRLPSGHVLARHDVASALPESPPVALDASPAARKAWLQQALAPVFKRRGWQTQRGEFWFIKNGAAGQARVFANAERRLLKHGVWLRLDWPARLQPALSSDGGPQLMLSLDYFARRAGLNFSFEAPAPLLNKRAGDPVYALPMADAEQTTRCRDELAAVYDGVVLDWLSDHDSLQALEHQANRVDNAACPFIGLRQRNDGHDLLHYHPDLLLAAAVDAPDFEQRARERVAMYEADSLGRFALPSLRALLAVCGLNL
ncbi:hypothetical protein [Aquabacterium sp. OR-4]|uniref:hypothetical protein n=1 Tax=Aquabacterium sp. OR-4 TaxID=2978127 RepID=UPI0028CA93BB|nr:hypothetical protein [Aquabacterium sp. OR-4]MDT7838369.1 hypothetical protein [Aquabacterium sp. OR-4]